MKPGFHPDGLPARLLAFFHENPDEELTYADIAAKFDAKMSNAQHAVSVLRGHGIESVHVIRFKAHQCKEAA